MTGNYASFRIALMLSAGGASLAIASGAWAGPAPGCIDGAGAGSTECGTNATTLAALKATAVGNGANATKDMATAVGESAMATGTGSSAFGQNAQATAPDKIVAGILVPANATAIGMDSKATGTNATAVGQNAQATDGTNNSAFGAGAKASALDTIDSNGNPLLGEATALGVNANASGNRSTALGVNALASQLEATAIGHSANASGPSATAIGTQTQATAENAVAIGRNTIVAGKQSVGIGSGAIVDLGVENALAIGGAARVQATNGVAIGPSALAKGSNSVALGSNAQTDNDFSVAIGFLANAQALDSLAFGRGAKSENNDAIAVGTGADAAGDSSIAIGGSITGKISQAFGNASIALGVDTVSGVLNDGTIRNTVAIGTGARSIFNNSVALGPGAIATFADQIMLGRKADAANGIAGTAIVIADIGASKAKQDQTAGGVISLLTIDQNGVLGFTPQVGGGIGLVNNATGMNGLSVLGALASDVNGLALGEMARAGTVNSTALGSGAFAGDPIGVGIFNNAVGASAFGNMASATGPNATALGRGASAVTDGAFAGGDGAVAGLFTESGYGSPINDTAVGHNASATGGSSVAIGNGATAGDGTVGIGVASFAGGRFANASTDSSTALGAGAIAGLFDDSDPLNIVNNRFAFAGGNSATATGESSVALGNSALAEGRGSIALGANSVSGFSDPANLMFANSTVALGDSSQALFDRSTAIGFGATTTDLNQITLGCPAGDLTCGSVGTTVRIAELGRQAALTGSSQFLIIGTDGTIGFAPLPAAGTPSSCVDGAGTGSIQCGMGASTGTATNASALGSGSMAMNNGSTALGFGAQTTMNNQVVIGGAGSTVALGGYQGSGSLPAGSFSVLTIDPNGNLVVQTIASGPGGGGGGGATGLVNNGTAPGSIAIRDSVSGITATATAVNATALGNGANAGAANATAIGNGATAAFASATAIGDGTTATRADQIALGTATTSVTIAGASAGNAFQTGTISFLTVDANGNVGTSSAPGGGVSQTVFNTLQSTVNNQGTQITALQTGQTQLFNLANQARRDIRKANEGVALALAMDTPFIPDDLNYAISGGIGYYQNRTAVTTAFSGRISEKAFLTAGIGVGLDSGEVGARGGFQFAW